jgi:hypothetical protein
VIQVTRGREVGREGTPQRADILVSVTTTLESLARRTTVVLAAAATVLATAGPASAEVPEGWSDPDAVSVLQAILVLVGIPLLLFLVISVLVYLPAMVRGERVAPGGATRENQWFGGPRKGTAELAAADTEESKAGGASGRW